jgi:hypothetical protein
MTVCASDGAARVKAGAGELEAASIAAPVTAAIVPLVRMRNFIASS